MNTFNRKLDEALSGVIVESAGGFRLFRTDHRFGYDDMDKLLRLVRSGRYDGRYYTSKMVDAAIYYPNRIVAGKYDGLMIEVNISGDLTTDGHICDSVLFDSPDMADEAVASLMKAGVPIELVDEFRSVVDDQDMSAAHYYGRTSAAKVAILKKLFKYIGPAHLDSHGQVALLDRELHPDEFVRAMPYVIEGGVVSIGDDRIKIRDVYLPQFSG